MDRQTAVAADLGVKFFPLYDVSEFFRQDLDVVVLSVSILAFEEVRAEPFARVHPGQTGRQTRPAPRTASNRMPHPI